MHKAIWNGEVIAESDDIVELEGNSYFPAASVKKQFISKSEHQTVCAWKGTASYFDIEVQGKRNENAAWYYSNPNEAASQITGRVAFWKGVKIEKV